MARFSTLGLALVTVWFSPLAIANGDTPLAPESNPSCISYVNATEKNTNTKTSRIVTNAFDNLQNKRIRHIEFKTLSVFDENNPKENNQFYLFLNKLHVNTRPNVLRTQLLFKEGEPLDIQHLHESERILRTRGYLANAYILPSVICAEEVDLMVVTQDSWALEPQVSLSRKSEGTKSGFAIADGNILGTGSSLTIGYDQDSERNAVSYDISNPHILNSQISARLFYADTSDGQNSIIQFEHPFYSLDTPWAAGIKVEDLALVDLIRHGDKDINQYRHLSQFNEIYTGFATHISEKSTHRFLVGASREEDTFETIEETLQPIPDARKANYPWLEYQYIQNRFGVFKNINQIQRPEDIALGSNLTLRLGYAGTQFNNPDDVVRYIGSYTNTLNIGDQHITEAKITLNGRHHSNSNTIDSGVLGLSFAYHYLQDDKNRWYSAIRYDVGQDLAQHDELTAGDITGLRGYPSDYQRGEERYVFTLERRYFSDIHIFNLLRVGGVVFFDMGKAWGLNAYGASPLLTNVGFGLRFSSTKVRIGNVVHVDIATPTSARKGLSQYQVTIGAQKVF
jgi:outer membrane protein assembly factor BamA